MFFLVIIHSLTISYIYTFPHISIHIYDMSRLLLSFGQAPRSRNSFAAR